MIKKIYIFLLLLLSGLNLLKGQTPPEPPVIENISYNDAASEVYISWFPSPTPDISGYIIYREKNHAWLSIDTVKDPLATSYIDKTSNAGGQFERYKISAYQNVPKFLASEMSELHNTIYTFPYKNICLSRDSVVWNHYVNWPGGVSGYEIFVSVDYGPIASAGSVPGTVNYFIDEGLEPERVYCYLIKAYNKDSTLTSLSNHGCLFTEILKTPEMLNANFATVTDFNKVTLSFSIDTSADISGYTLLKSQNPAGPFLPVAQFGKSSLSPIEYTDLVNVFYDTYYYQLIVTNSCGIDIMTSNPANNIVLRAKADHASMTNFLTWNDYTAWLGSIENYTVYRMVDDSAPEVIAILDPMVGTSYTDDVSEYLEQPVQGDFRYYIEAVEGNTNPYGIKGVSRSNIACAAQPPLFYMPNAFNPNSNIEKNKIFKPVVSFASPDNYQFIIYDRWGEKIFETTDPTEGWNGKIRKKEAAPGMYVFLVRFFTAENETFEKSGTFLMIKQKYE